VPLSCSLTAAAAAELRIDPSQGPQHGAVLEGKIEVGDYERFRKQKIASTRQFVQPAGMSRQRAIRSVSSAAVSSARSSRGV
jgi:hypothetical protein